MSQFQKVWTRARLENADVSELPSRIGSGFRKRKDESWHAWRQRILMLVDEGKINLTPKKSEAPKTLFEQRSPATIQGLYNFGVKDESDARRYTEMDYDRPALARLNPRAESMAEVPPDVRGGMFHLRTSMAQVVEKTIDLKLEEANCPLFCYECPAGRVLGCSVTHMTVAKEEGVDTSSLLIG